VLATLTVKVPLKTGQLLDAKLSAIQHLHEEEMRKLEKTAMQSTLRSATSGDARAASRAQRSRAALSERGRKLTMANLVRVIVEAGLSSVEKDSEALRLISESGTLRGRPRGT
jgi:hypothetical protein